jgi:hypothetical protein
LIECHCFPITFQNYDQTNTDGSDGEENFDLDVLSDEETDMDNFQEDPDDIFPPNSRQLIDFKTRGDKAVKRNRNFKRFCVTIIFCESCFVFLLFLLTCRASLAVAGVAAIGVSVATMGLATPAVLAVGATAVGVGGAGMAVKSRKPTADAMVLAAESLETAEWWRNGIQQSIHKATARAKVFVCLSSHNVCDWHGIA